MLKITSKGIEEVWECSEVSLLLQTYLFAVDRWISTQTDPSSVEIASDFSTFPLEMKTHTDSENDCYKVEMQIFRSHLTIKLVEKNIVDQELIPSSLFDSKTDEKSELIIHLSNIKKITTDSIGFYILTGSAEQTYRFEILDDGVKADIIRKIVKMSEAFVFRKISVENYSKDSIINLSVEDNSIANIFRIHSVLRMTPFGDLIKINIFMNDIFLYETLDDIIINRIALSKLFALSIVHENLRLIVLQYLDEEVIYVMDAEDQNSFLSQIIGNLGDKQLDNEAFFVKRGMLFTERVNLRRALIFGADKSSAFSDLYEKKFLNSYLESPTQENLDEMLYNSHITEQGTITLKEIARKWASLLHWPEKFKDGLSIRVSLEDEKYKILVNEGNSKEVESDLALATSEHEARFQARFGGQLKLKSLGTEALVDRYWKTLANLMKKQKVFKEASQTYGNTNTENSDYISLLRITINTQLMEHSPTLNFSAGKVLKFFICYFGGSSFKKIETLNKYMLLNETQGFNYFKTVSEFMMKCLLGKEAHRSRQIALSVFSLESILKLFESIMFKCRDSTLDKDLQKTLSLLKNPFFFQCLAHLSMASQTELIFHSSLCMNSIIECLNDREKVHEYQRLLLNNSTLLLRHLELCLSPVSLKQKQSSILFIYHCLIDNALASSLMTRLIPKPLFSTVEEEVRDISKWSLSQWESLVRNLNSDFNSAMQQWSSESRSELLAILRSEIHFFYCQFKPLTKDQGVEIIKEIFESNDFSMSSKKTEEMIQLRWNFEEYEAKQEVLRKKLPVYKYYIDELLKDEKDPKLSVQNIINPKRFWEELTSAFLATENTEELTKYLKCFILLYKKYSKLIKEVTFLKIVLQLVQKGKSPLPYLALQFILAALNVEDKVIQVQNIKKFLDSDGLNVILDHIKSCQYLEDLNQLDYQNLEKVATNPDLRPAQRKDSVQVSSDPSDPKAKVSRRTIQLRESKAANTYNDLSKDPTFVPTFMYYSQNFSREALTMELQKSNEIIFCIKIFHSCILRTKSQATEALLLTPRPLARQIAYERSTILLFQQCLFLKDDFLLTSILDFLIDTYMDKFNYRSLTDNLWIFPLLLNRITLNCQLSIARFFKEVLRNLISNSEPDVQTFFEDIQRMNIASPVCSLALYDSENTISYTHSLFKVIAGFPCLLYLPAYFWHILDSRDPEAFIKLLTSEKVESPLIKWNGVYLDMMKTSVEKVVSSLTPFDFSTEFDFTFTSYPFGKEKLVGGVSIRNWLEADDPKSFLNSKDVADFAEKIYSFYFSMADALFEQEAKGSEQIDISLLNDLELGAQAVVMLLTSFESQNPKLVDYVTKILRSSHKMLRNQIKVDSTFPFKMMVWKTFLSVLKVLQIAIQKKGSIKIYTMVLSSPELKTLLLEIFSGPLHAFLQGNCDLTYFRLKASRMFLKIYSGLIENSNFELISLKSEAGSGSFDVEHILANMFVNYFSEIIGFLIGSNQLMTASGDRLVQENDMIQAANFRRKQTPDYRSQNDLKSKPTNSSTQLLTGGSPNNNKNESPVMLSGQKFRLVFVKKDWEALSDFFGNFDPTETNLLNFFHERIAAENVVLAVRRKCMRYLEVWMDLIKKCSRNSKNIDKFISSGLAFRCLLLSFKYPAMKEFKPHPNEPLNVRTNLQRFFFMSFGVFQLILSSAARSSIKMNPDMPDIFKLKVDWRYFTSSESSGESSDLQVTFYSAIKKLFDYPFIVMSLNCQSAEDFLQKLPNGLSQLDFFLNDTLIFEIANVIRSQLRENLKSGTFTKFDLIFKAELSELKNQQTIGGIYLSYFLDHPTKLNNAVQISSTLLELIHANPKEPAVVPLIHFLNELNIHNSSSLKFTVSDFELVCSVAEKLPLARSYALSFLSLRATESTPEANIISSLPEFISLAIVIALDDSSKKLKVEIPLLKVFEELSKKSENCFLAEVLIYRLLVSTQEEEKLFASQLLLTYKLPPNAHELIDCLEHTQGFKLIPSHLIGILDSKDIYHPFIVINSASRTSLRTNLHSWLKTLIEKRLASHPELNYMSIVSVAIQPSFQVFQINLGMFLNSKDNSFVFNPLYSEIFHELLKSIKKETTPENINLILSSILLLVDSHPFNQKMIEVDEALALFEKSDMSIELQVLALQLLSKLPPNLIKNHKGLLKILADNFVEILAKKKFDFVSKLTLILLIVIFQKSKSEFPLAQVIHEKSFVKMIIDFKKCEENDPGLLNFIDHILSLSLLHDLVSSPSIIEIKEQFVSSYFEIIAKDSAELLSQVLLPVKVDKVDVRQSLDFWLDESRSAKTELKLPVMYVPSMKIGNTN